MCSGEAESGQETLISDLGAGELLAVVEILIEGRSFASDVITRHLLS